MEDPSPRSFGSSDERFETSRAVAKQGGYASSGDERFETPRNATSRSYHSEKDYKTPRDGGQVSGEDESDSYHTGREDKHAYDVPIMQVGYVPTASYPHVSSYGYPTVPVMGYSADATYLGTPYVVHGPSTVAGAPAYGAGWGQGAVYYPVAQSKQAPISRKEEKRTVEDIFSLTRHNRHEEVEALLSSGIPVSVRDQYGNTVLSIACQNGLKRLAKLALRRGADINSQNYKGNTPLHFCFMYGYGDTLGEYLISKGADTQVRNLDGLTCFEVASGAQE